MKHHRYGTAVALGDHLARAARGADAVRIRPVLHEGQRYWVKRCETLSLRWRLQKGNPARRFARERAVFAAMIAKGAPVPKIVAEGPDWFALPDCGDSLETVFARADGATRVRAFAEAGAAMARLHALGLAHGRPHPRDLCWDGAQIRFLDFERGHAGRAAPWRQAFDVIQMVFALHAMRLDGSDALDAFASAYRASDARGVWPGARRLCRRLRWLDPLTRTVQRHERLHKPHRRYKEWQALPGTLAYFAASSD